MNIYIAFLQDIVKHKTIPAYSFWQYYLKNGIQEAGFNWYETSNVDWAEGLTYDKKNEQLQNWKDITWERVINDLKYNRKKDTIFLSYLYPKQVDINAISEIKRMGIPTVNFFCDNVREFSTVPDEFKIFDLNWVPEYKALKMYKQAGINFIHLPMPMWVAPQDRIITHEEQYNVSFIGSIDIQRLLLFSEIASNYPELDLSIYGNGWLREDNNEKKNYSSQGIIQKVKNQVEFIFDNGLSAYTRKLNQRNQKEIISDILAQKIKHKITFDEYIDITKKSQIVLGVNRYPSFKYPLYRPNTYSRLRDIEAPMLGACYLTESTEGLDQMYSIGQEIESYSNTDELIYKIEELSKFPKKRNKMRVYAQEKALNQLSIPQSLNKLKEYFKIN